VCFYLVLRHGSFSDKMSASLIAALLVSPHTYWQDYSLAAVIAMLGVSPVARVVLLLPWPYLYPHKDELPMILISLAYLIALGVKQAFRPAPDLATRPGIRGIAASDAGSAFTNAAPGG
jgi:hypothetical protein